MSGRRQWQPTSVLLSGKSHGRRSLVGCSLWGREESDTTERLHFHFSLSCIGEGNGNPLQCSCLENPRDRGAWWAAVYGVAQSQTRLEQLSSSSRMVTPFQNGSVTLPSSIRGISVYNSEKYFLKKKTWKSEWLLICELQNECSVNRHENHINLVLYLHQSPWVVRCIINEQ